MYKYFKKFFKDEIIEDLNGYLIFLIPGDKLSTILEWYGKKRAEAFNHLGSKNILNDIEERDIFYTHMIIWDKKLESLAGGQRFLFNNDNSRDNSNISYVESYHPGTYKILKNKDFCEIGRTFVMPEFQNRKVLKELIRGFVRIPEGKKIRIGLGLISFDHTALNSKAINYFLNILENSKTNSLNLPEGKYLYGEFEKKSELSLDLNFDWRNLKIIESELKTLDNKFKLPPVLSPYLKLCGIVYENYSLAKEYNGIIQLLFSGRSENITPFQRSLLKEYNSVK